MQRKSERLMPQLQKHVQSSEIYKIWKRQPGLLCSRWNTPHWRPMLCKYTLRPASFWSCSLTGLLLWALECLVLRSFWGLSSWKVVWQSFHNNHNKQQDSTRVAYTKLARHPSFTKKQQCNKKNTKRIKKTKSASVLMGKSLNFFLGWVRARAPLIGSKTDTGGARARANPTKKKV